MKAMLNNAIRGDYIAAETDPSVSLYKKEMWCPENSHTDPVDGYYKFQWGGVSKLNF